MILLSEAIASILNRNASEGKLADVLYVVADKVADFKKISIYADDIRLLADKIVLTPYRIKTIRKKLGMSQTDFGVAINPNLQRQSVQHFVSLLESGQIKLTIRVSERIRYLRAKAKSIKSESFVNPFIQELLNKVNPETGKRVTQRDIARILRLTPSAIHQIKSRQFTNHFSQKHLPIIQRCLKEFDDCNVQMKA